MDILFYGVGVGEYREHASLGYVLNLNGNRLVLPLLTYLYLSFVIETYIILYSLFVCLSTEIFRVSKITRVY